MPRPCHFELHAENPERAIAFYTAVLGWEFRKWAGPMPYWLIITGPEGSPGIDGGLLPRRGPGPSEGQPVNAYVVTVDVPAIDDWLAKVTAHGGLIAHPKMPIPGVGWLAYGKDPEGNIFGMMQTDPTAK